MKLQFSEAIKLKDGVFYNLPYHQARMDRTLDEFGGMRIHLASALANTNSEIEQGLFKCRLVYGRYGIEDVAFIPYSPRLITTVEMVIADDIEYGYKYTDRECLNKLHGQSDCDDIIIIKNGLVTDAFASNLVFESAEGLFTPDSCLLSGTKRRFLLDQGKIRQRRIRMGDIYSYNCIRFINAMVDLEDNVCVKACEVKA